MISWSSHSDDKEKTYVKELSVATKVSQVENLPLNSLDMCNLNYPGKLETSAVLPRGNYTGEFMSSLPRVV